MKNYLTFILCFIFSFYITNLFNFFTLPVQVEIKTYKVCENIKSTYVGIFYIKGQKEPIQNYLVECIAWKDEYSN